MTTDRDVVRIMRHDAPPEAQDLVQNWRDMVQAVHRRAAQLIYSSPEERPFTVGEVRAQLLAEFGPELVAYAADDLRQQRQGTP